MATRSTLTVMRAVSHWLRTSRSRRKKRKKGGKKWLEERSKFKYRGQFYERLVNERKFPSRVVEPLFPETAPRNSYLVTCDI